MFRSEDDAQAKRTEGELPTKATRMIDSCLNSLTQMIEYAKTNLERTVLTRHAIEFHDALEKIMAAMARCLKNEVKDSRKNDYIVKNAEVLPDLAVAAILWDRRPPTLLKSIKMKLEDLRALATFQANRSKEKLSQQLIKWLSGLKELEDETRIMASGNRNTLLESHSFLSQQIDERSHQIFTMGPIFVPISFLIFASAMAAPAGLKLPIGFLLAGASLTCYLAWFLMYLRVGNLNESSYPLLHGLEFTLGLSSHNALNELRKKKRLLRMRQEVFYVSLNVLVTLWMLYLITFFAELNDVAMFTLSVYAVTLSFMLPIMLGVLGLKGVWNALSTQIVAIMFLALYAGGIPEILLATGSIVLLGLLLLGAAFIAGMLIMIAQAVISTLRYSKLLCRSTLGKELDADGTEQKKKEEREEASKSQDTREEMRRDK